MQRLRTTFTRSRTPTGAEMKTQSSLEVPKQVRSASFDEMQLEAQRAAQLIKQSSADERSPGFLQVPQSHSQQRSHSFDSASAGSDDSGTFLEVPRRFKRRSSSTKTPPPCIHCLYLEEYERQQKRLSDDNELRSPSSYSSTSTSEDEGVDEYESGGSPKFGNTLLPPFSSPCNITFTLSPTSSSPPPIPSDIAISTSPPTSPNFPTSPALELPLCFDNDESPIASSTARVRRRSISRQEAIFVEPVGNSLENVCDVSEDDKEKPHALVQRKTTDETEDEADGDDDERSDTSERDKDSEENLEKLENKSPVDVVRDIYLAVPDLKRDRAASVDSCFTKVSSGKTEELQPNDCFLSVPNINTTRSRSVDIVLPTDEQARYKALALTGTYSDGKSAGITRPLRIVPDWSENAINGDHLWVPTSASGDLCCVPDECRKNGQRMKCSACQLIAHINCIPLVNEKTQLACKPTFRDVGIRQYREQTTTHHHWVHRRTEKSKCKQCSKAIPNKLFGSKEIVALTCAWCKSSYHNKESCFNPERIGEQCNLGTHAGIIVPPSWIVKLPTKGNFKSSLRLQKRKSTTKKKSKDKEQKAFVVKPIPNANITPVIVFINPKSGGNQGVKLLSKFQWLLNPRQVFDLTQGGPKMGLELFRKAPQLRILACGGDGTAGWVLSVLDQINVQPPPAVGVLPLGTGNDLARALGWGGGYTDEPIGGILSNIGKSDTVLLDRWSLRVEPNEDADRTAEDGGKDNLPLNVVNNYFSFGVDAHIALEFHEAREAHPEKFNSRLKNKMFYGTAGGKDLLQRKWRALADFVTLECDGQDYTPKLKEHRVHAILFLNIPSYGGGTHPWNDSATNIKPATDDGLIEVVGLTTYQLPMLQAGAHGTCICQCKSARIVTTKTIPMQVDGEAARLKPSIIELDLLNKAVMLAKKKKGRTNVQLAGLEPLNLSIHLITMPHYEQHHYDKDLLRQTAVNLGQIEVEPGADLEQVRNIINKYCEEQSNYSLSNEWCFVDTCTAERCFRIDRAQENLHYIMDIANDVVYVLDQECATMPQTPDADGSFAAFQKRQEQNAATHNDMHHNDPNNVNNNKIQLRRTDNKVEENQIKIRSTLLEKTSEAVLLAAKTGDIILLQALHEQGYSLLSIDIHGQTALHYAAQNNSKEIVKYLISCAPNSIINMVDNIKGQTALHMASARKFRDICVMLVAAGASLSIMDSGGNTPMMLAFNADAADLAAYLESQERFFRMDIQANI